MKLVRLRAHPKRGVNSRSFSFLARFGSSSIKICGIGLPLFSRFQILSLIALDESDDIFFNSLNVFFSIEC